MLFTMYSRSAGESSGSEKSTESRSCGEVGYQSPLRAILFLFVG